MKKKIDIYYTLLKRLKIFRKKIKNNERIKKFSEIRKEKKNYGKKNWSIRIKISSSAEQ
jgi:hypothetical protein